RRGIWLRPFGAGLIEGGSVSTSMMAFVLLLLSSVLYDGALGTPEWGRLEVAIAAHLSALGDFKLMAIRTTGLFAFWLVFCGAYVGVSAIMSAVAQQRLAPLEFARSFAFTLVPIAIGYHFAHYFTFLLIQGQYIIPLTALMVVYTFVSLSILAEPIVERRAPAQPVAVEIDVPEDALLPQQGTGRLQQVGAGKVAKQKLTYRVLGSAFHDGTRMSAADVLYSYAFAYRCGAGRDGEDAHY